MRRDAFQAIADPTRRHILQLISETELNITALAENFQMSRPAVSQQVKILVESGLVKIRKEGRERYCKARFEKLKPVFNWVAKYEVFWSSKLDHLEDLLLKESLNETNIIKHGKRKKLKH
jgi:DNA-binding transcriptional ArsR family regulator